MVEGWMHEYAMREAAAEYAIIGTFLRLVVRTIGKGGYINDYYTSASVGAELLQKRLEFRAKPFRWYHRT